MFSCAATFARSIDDVTLSVPNLNIDIGPGFEIPPAAIEVVLAERYTEITVGICFISTQVIIRADPVGIISPHDKVRNSLPIICPPDSSINTITHFTLPLIDLIDYSRDKIPCRHMASSLL
jgi:hypothetical protein